MKPYMHMLSLCAPLMLLTACPGDPASGTGDGTGTDGITSAGPDATSASTLSSSSATSASTSTSDATSGPFPTTGEETSGGCVDASDCDNGIFCDGVESCVDQVCVSGDPVDCTDAVDCTADACDLELDACVNQPLNDRCGCGETCDPQLGCGDYCVTATCQGQIYECGNCIDDDADCKVDSSDPDCWGPCDNNESGWNGEVPGQQNQSTCLVMDCYFDSNSGAGNDECYWSHSCDPLEPSGCTYNPEQSIPGTSGTCQSLLDEQLPACADYCGPLTPNGCDCFGCCDVTLDDASTVTVYLGTLDGAVGTCNLDVVEDPALCHPCTQVNGCLNTCEECEICLGQVELPPGCEKQVCPEGIQPCGLAGQDPCPETLSCITGCCVPNPQ